MIGNPPHVPTEESRKLVRDLAPYLPNNLLAEKMGIARSTLHKYYQEELSAGKAELVAELGRSVIAKARNGDNDMIKYYLNGPGGWNPKQVHEHVGAGGGPIQHVDLSRLAVEFAGMSEDELAVAERVLALVASSGPAGGPDLGGGSATAVEGGAAEPAP